ncbi:MAG: hypothetical protein JXB38_12910 [Anaerolineales bacterium]|nr:hypothetical protein [Anaerolineales bacterium]
MTTQKFLRSICWVTCSLFVLALVACSNPAASPDGAPAGADAPSASEIQAAILSAFENQYEFSHHIENTITTTDSEVFVTIDYFPPDRYAISSQDNYYTQIIIIGETVYGFADSQWAVLPMQADQLINPNALEELEATLQDLQYLGTETLNGELADVYSYQSQTTIGESQVPQTSRLWLGASDGLPYKIVIDGQIATMDARTGKIEGIPAVTTQVITYDPDLTIEAPIP